MSQPKTAQRSSSSSTYSLPSASAQQPAFVTLSPPTVSRTGTRGAHHRQVRCTMNGGQKEGRVETMVHSRQVGYSTLEEMEHFLRHEPREKRYGTKPASSASPSTGSGKRRASARNGIERADCYIEPDGQQVIISPGFF